MKCPLCPYDPDSPEMLSVHVERAHPPGKRTDKAIATTELLAMGYSEAEAADAVNRTFDTGAQ